MRLVSFVERSNVSFLERSVLVFFFGFLVTGVFHDC